MRNPPPGEDSIKIQSAIDDPTGKIHRESMRPSTEQQSHGLLAAATRVSACQPFLISGLFDGTQKPTDPGDWSFQELYFLYFCKNCR